MTLLDQWTDLKKTSPRLRARDAALELGVSEAQLVASTVGRGAVRLTGPWTSVLEGVPALGEVMALTRNDAVVHERTGPYVNVRFEEGQPAGGVFGDEIDLRIFPGRWAFGFATDVETPKGPRPSLQFFDASGEAIHKIYLGADAPRDAYDALVARFTHPDQGDTIEVTAAPPAPVDGPVPEAFLAGWDGLADTHDFDGLLRAHRVTRRAGLRAAEGRHTTKVDAVSTFDAVLRLASERQVPIMVFVGNPGCIQIHGGTVSRVVPKDGWLNVLDARFNLHVRTELLDSAWIVRKPTRDGTVTSVEVLTADGRTAALLFGYRKPGIPENPAWRALLDDITTPA